ncbi:hypothetical protein ZPR_0014 [Zunongwangia profunda SM-A87]|uniref:Uncharacterized protein n=1 Tax=Zunongwangia profunda (strain DSM 18752 / CCTCC AB 206139 / SM-A87) TaxID=655815 RepID=D5BBE4_ZUNPS|nr:hypothetical protein ZPR_0014 [Zunongwangia profunda SM-A87]
MGYFSSSFQQSITGYKQPMKFKVSRFYMLIENFKIVK